MYQLKHLLLIHYVLKSFILDHNLHFEKKLIKLLKIKNLLVKNYESQ